MLKVHINPAHELNRLLTQWLTASKANDAAGMKMAQQAIEALNKKL